MSTGAGRGLLWRVAGCLVVLAVVATGLMTGDRPTPKPTISPAADLTQFNPGNIISDAIFFNGGAMDASGVQTFLNLKGLSCRASSDGVPCLKDYVQDTTSRPGDAFCPAGYTAGSRESAALIITKVAASCGINPQVLLVMLQKEQGLVQASGSGLTTTRYQKAMGFACPDTAACDAAYFGFQNQVYSAARQYQRYAASPASFGYRVGRTSNVLFNPNAACGSTPVYIQNQATAGLYVYTPYQPNAAALSAGYGAGDACSAYGNRNFYQYFTDWFGSTQSPGQSVWQPVGALDQPTATGRIVTVSGWAVDPDDVNVALAVHVYVDGQGVAILRADQYASAPGSYNGFTTKLPMAAGTHSVCAYGINIGAGTNNTSLGCRPISVSAALGDSPIGLVGASASGRTVSVGGWVVDPNALATALDVHVYADGRGVAIVRAADAGAPTATTFPGAGSAHGFQASLALGSGRHEICAYGINIGAGVNTLLGCEVVVVDPAAFNPVGSWDSATTDGPAIVVSGWAQDLDAAGTTAVHMYVDGAATVLTADQPNNTVDGHGFVGRVRAAVGTHSVCLYSINVGEGTANILLGCRNVTIDATAYNPTGSLTSVGAVGGTMTVTGTVSDPDLPGGGASVHVYVDGRPVAAAVAAQADSVGPGRVFTASVVVADGARSVCAYGINAGAGTTNVLLGCSSVTVSGIPSGALDPVTARGGAVAVTGRVVDPDVPGAPVPVHVYVDGRGAAVLSADQADASAPGHGFATTLALSEGGHSICAYGINLGPGASNVLLGCSQVVVDSNPVGALDPVTAVGLQTTVSGWATDPDAGSSAVMVHVYVDGRWVTALPAGQTSAVAPGHGYSASLALAEGWHLVCTYGINVGAGTSNVLLGCSTVLASSNPVGALRDVVAAGGQLTVTGWVTDPDLPAGPLSVHVYVDGTPVAVVAAAQADPASGGLGYSVVVPATAGRHTVCTYGINTGAGTSNVLLGCRLVTA